jgi:demethoxyubiquinone hydroxylase (CLK1/Coq7/Cat5 family)
VNEQREALIPALVRIILRYIAFPIGGATAYLADDPDIALVVTVIVGMAVEAWYARDWVKRGAK